MSYTRLRYHLVFATKNRKPIIDETVEEELYPLLQEISEDLGGRTVAVGGMADHVHTISAIPPDIAVSKFVRDLKSRTSGKIKQGSCSEFGWQIGFGGFTLNPHDMRHIFGYVINQERHHRNDTTRPDFEQINRDECNSDTDD